LLFDGLNSTSKGDSGGRVVTLDYGGEGVWRGAGEACKGLEDLRLFAVDEGEIGFIGCSWDFYDTVMNHKSS
jgi:hypothetical protein